MALKDCMLCFLISVTLVWRGILLNFAFDMPSIVARGGTFSLSAAGTIIPLQSRFISSLVLQGTTLVGGLFDPSADNRRMLSVGPAMQDNRDCF